MPKLLIFHWRDRHLNLIHLRPPSTQVCRNEGAYLQLFEVTQYVVLPSNLGFPVGRNSLGVYSNTLLTILKVICAQNMTQPLQYLYYKKGVRLKSV